MNVQYAVLGDDLYVIEANPRASRTVPFVSKATGIPLAKVACRVMLGEKLAALDLPADPGGDHVAVKEAVHAVRPLRRLGLAARPGDALDRRGHGRGRGLPGRVREGAGGGGRAAAAQRHGVPDRDRLRQGRARWASPRSCTTSASRSWRRAGRRRRSRAWASRWSRSTRSPRARRTSSTGSSAATSTSSSTPRPAPPRARDGYEIRGAATARGIPCITTLSGGMAAARAIAAARHGEPEVVSLQDLHARGSEAALNALTARSAPFGRRLCPVVAHATLRRLRRHLGARRRGPGARPGPVLHARRGRALGRWRGRAAVPPARVLGAAPPRRRAPRLPVRGRRPGHAAAVRAARRRRAVAARAAGRRLPRAGGRPAAAARRRRGGDRAAGDLAGRDRRARAARLPRRAPRRGRRAAARPRGWRPTTARSASTGS